jgi:hypothetical protein
MAKIYTKTRNAFPKILPKKQTVDFILNYSKALTICKVNGKTFEMIGN